MSNHRHCAAMIVRQWVRAHEWHLCTIGTCDLRDFGIVCGNDDLVKTAASQGCLNRPSDHRLATKTPDVLAWNSLAAAPSWDDGNNWLRSLTVHRTPSTPARAAITLFCSD